MIQSLRAGLVVVLFALPSLGMDILAPVELRGALEAALPTFSKELGVTVAAAYYEDSCAAAQKSIECTRADVFVAADEEAFRSAQSQGLVSGQGVAVFYKRLAIAVAPGNPSGVYGLEDLARPGLRLVVQPFGQSTAGTLTASVLQRAPDRDTMRGNIVGQTASSVEMLSFLSSGKADALLCWDTLETAALGRIAVMRLPWTVCATHTCRGAVTRFAEDTQRAGKVLAFLASKDMAAILFARGFWMEDGKEGGQVMDRTARGAFAPMYPLLAKQIVDDYGIKEGVCVDIGCGPGQLPTELAKITRLRVWGVDIEPQALELARAHAREAGLGDDRIRFIAGDALCLPLPDNFADLVISRGTVPFLRDKPLGFREAYRILKPGGVAFMGGGFSRYQSPESVAEMRRVSGENEPGRRLGAMKMDFPAILKEAGIVNYRIVRDNGAWVEMRK